MGHRRKKTLCLLNLFRKLFQICFKSFSIHITTMLMYFRIYFVTNMVNLLSTLKRIKLKINILSGLPGIIVSVQCVFVQCIPFE